MRICKLCCIRAASSVLSNRKNRPANRKIKINVMQQADAYFNAWNTSDADSCANNVAAAERFGHALNVSRNTVAEDLRLAGMLRFDDGSGFDDAGCWSEYKWLNVKPRPPR